MRMRQSHQPIVLHVPHAVKHCGMDRKEKVILVTGASSGFGKEISRLLASRGHVVYGTSRKAEPSLFGEGVRPLQMDVRDRDSVRCAVERIVADSGRIDVLVNNAGLGIGGSVELATPQEIDLQIGTNFLGMANVTSAVLPYMRRARSGRIVNLSSIAGVIAVPYQGFYSASKFAIEGYSEALAVEVHNFGISVCLVEPGDFCTGFTSKRVISEATMKDPDYSAVFARVLADVEKSENGGSAPKVLARAVVKIVESRRPRFRTVVGPLTQCILARLRPFLPDRLVLWALRKFYPVD